MSELFPALQKAPAVGLRVLTAPWRALRWFGRGLRRRARVLLYGLVALVAVHLAATLVTGLMLSKEMARQRAAGNLLTVKQLVPQVPAGAENAATLYQKAFDALRISTDDEVRLLGDVSRHWVPSSPAEHPSPQWVASARPILAANAESLKWARQAARLPYCAFPVDWKAGPDMQFQHPARLRAVARLLQVDAGVAAADSRTDDALTDAATMLRMAEHLKMEPALVSQLVAYAIQDIAVRAIRTALSLGTPSVPAARDFMRLLASDQVGPSVASVKGEVTLLGLPVFRIAAHGGRGTTEILNSQGSAGDPDVFWQLLLLRGYGTIGRPLLNVDQRSYLRTMAAELDAFTRPWPESQHRAQHLQTQLESRPTYRAPLTRMLVPIFERAIWARDKAAAELDDAQIALALAVYKAEHGAYPDSLAVLEKDGTKLPRDPFGGESYRYDRQGAGFVVYSVGPDMRDDGGVPPTWDTAEQLSPEQQSARGEHYDLPFRVPR